MYKEKRISAGRAQVSLSVACEHEEAFYGVGVKLRDRGTGWRINVFAQPNTRVVIKFNAEPISRKDLFDHHTYHSDYTLFELNVFGIGVHVWRRTRNKIKAN